VGPAGALGTQTNGVSWRLVFSSGEQAAMKTLALPDGWREDVTYVKVDLGADYHGTAGFLLEVNGEALGELSNQMDVPPYLTPSTTAWTKPVPRAVLARAPMARVVLRPSSLDPRLSIAGHGDPLVEPLKHWNSWFFDGRGWRNDRLAGPAGGEAAGTYRIWLFRALGVPAEG
ncbi:MAG: hypothetical protein ACRDJN_02780, partial [Chloroflexota bacterium]